MYRVALRARLARRASVARPRLAPWAAGTVLAAAGALAAAPLPAAAATAGPLPSSGPAIAGWGVNNEGELGTGMATGPLVLVPRVAALPPGTQITQISPGCDFALALTSTGSVLAWGDNALGQLGNGTTGNFSATPAQVKFPAGVQIQAVAAGCNFSLAVTTGGQLWAWGENGIGQLGTGQKSDPKPNPVQVQLPAGVRVTTVSAGFQHTLALTTTGQLLAWGDNTERELGTGSTSGFDATPSLVQQLGRTRVAAVVAGDFYSQVVTTDGQVLGWGTQNRGALGNGRSIARRTVRPVRALVPPGLRVQSLFSGCFHSLALTTTGTVLSWGSNTLGELGIGSTKLMSSPVPLPVRLPLGSGPAVAVGGGCEHAMVLTSHGQVLDWGAGGLLGNGSATPSASPVQVQLPAGDPAIRISSGASANFSLALLAQIPQA